jgi:hypothetical protein
MKRWWRLAVLPISLGLLWAGMPAANAAYATSPTAGWYPNNGTVYAMAVSGNVVYIGGTFTAVRNSANGQTAARSRLAAFNASTGDLLSWNPGADDTVRALAVGPGGTVYAGGDFTHAAGAADTRIAAITPTGGAVATWNGNANSTVRSIVATSAGVYVAGNFGRISNAAQNGLAMLNATTGARIAGFDAHVTNGRVRALTLDGSTLYLGGSFTQLAGQSRPYAAAVDATSGALRSWSPAAICSGCQVLSMANDTAHVYVAIGGPGGGRAVSWAKSNASRTWLRHADGDCQAIAVSGGEVYVGGHFGPTFNSAQRHQLAVVNASNGALTSYALPFTGGDHPGTWAISAEPGQLRIGGGFAMSGTQIRRYGVFRTVG